MARDFGPVVQEEVRRLPEKYHSAAVVLCYWQSPSHTNKRPPSSVVRWELSVAGWHGHESCCIVA